MIPDLFSMLRSIDEQLARLDVEDLPSVPIVDVDVSASLPTATTAVYFLKSRSLGLVSIGRATCLRGRWRAMRHHFDARIIVWDRAHAQLRPSLELGDVRLHWWAMPRELLAVAEGALIRIHRPPWNSHRG